MRYADGNTRDIHHGIHMGISFIVRIDAILSENTQESEVSYEST